jgi:hypothetical protein
LSAGAFVERDPLEPSAETDTLRSDPMRPSTAAILVVAVAAAVFGFYKLGHRANNTAREVSTLAIGIPDQASVAAAEANLAGAVSAATAYRTEHGSYLGMTTAALGSLAGGVTVASADAETYCIESTIRSATVSVRGPTGAYVVAAC